MAHTTLYCTLFRLMPGGMVRGDSAVADFRLQIKGDKDGLETLQNDLPSLRATLSDRFVFTISLTENQETDVIYERKLHLSVKRAIDGGEWKISLKEGPRFMLTTKTGCPFLLALVDFLQVDNAN